MAGEKSRVSAWGDEDALNELLASVDAMRAEVGGEKWTPPVRQPKAPAAIQTEAVAHELTHLVFSHIDEILGEVA